uniref:Uncharacterized protein n=1 Tax=Anguilla anguilla TaxID=7936 RepID=A0A0E9V7H9_ANGAN
MSCRLIISENIEKLVNKT